MPKDFRKKDFGRALRGYAVDEVDKYLEAVTGEYRRLEKRSWETSKQLADAEKRLDEYAAAEADAAETLDAADSILEDANRQAGAILADSRVAAQQEAQGILKQASAAAAKTKDDALILRRKAESLLREADSAREAADAARAKAWEEIAAEKAEAVRQREEAEALRSEAAETARVTEAKARRLEQAVTSFLADVEAFRNAAESMANAQLSAARNFTKDTEGFLALLRSGSGSGAPDADNPDAAADADPADALGKVAGAFPGIEQAVAAMKDLIVEIPDDEPGEPDEPEEPGEPEEPEVPFEDPETFDASNEPDEPVEPDESEKPEEPDKPDAPDEPEEPDKPEEPGAPDDGAEAVERADELADSIRSLLADKPREESGRSALDLLDFEEPDSSRPPYKDVDFEALTASLRRDEPADEDRTDDEDDE